MPFFSSFRFAWLLLALLLSVPVMAQPSEATAKANKQLFDLTVDKLNYQTMEGAYDAKYVRKKFPVTLTTHDARKAFKDFNDDAGFQKLFLNYNDEAEKFKNRFSPAKGPQTLANFEKQLRGMLVDPNFEFFVRVMRRDDRALLIRKLERVIQAAVTQFDASGESAEDRQAEAVAAPDTPPTGDTSTTVDTGAPDEQIDALNETAVPDADPLASNVSTPASRRSEGGGWSGTLALVLALAACAGLGYLLFVVVPSLRAAPPADTWADETALAAPEDNLPETYAEESYHRRTELRFELLADEVDELKLRIRELELRLADALANAEPLAEADDADEYRDEGTVTQLLANGC